MTKARILWDSLKKTVSKIVALQYRMKICKSNKVKEKIPIP